MLQALAVVVGTLLGGAASLDVQGSAGVVSLS